MRHINEAGLNIIKEFEGLRLHAYPDPGTGGQPYTIGYGHTGGVKLSDVITLDRAKELLAQDVAATERAVDNFTKGKLNDNQFSALVSFAYNVGNWRSTPLFTLVLQGKYAEAATHFEKYDMAAGKVLPGLIRRRSAERALFDTPCT